MTGEHTPGPWALDDKTGSLTWGDVSFGAPVGAGGFVVASYSVTTIPRHQQAERLTVEHRANARLIAAAPDLLDVLGSIDEACQQGLNSPDGAHWEAALLDIMALARAAIAKATGEA